MVNFLSLLAATAVASASTIRINVGKSGVTFSPSTVNATTGDTLEFHFYAANHSVVQGQFDNACVPTPTGGFFSGFFATNNGSQNANVFSVTVNNTDPIVFYCSYGKHCQAGMAGVVNPTTNSNLANYQGLAKSVQQVQTPPSVFGGSVGPAPPDATTTTSGSPTAGPTDSGTPTPSTKPNAAGVVGVPVMGVLAAVAGAFVLV